MPLHWRYTNTVVKCTMILRYMYIIITYYYNALYSICDRRAVGLWRPTPPQDRYLFIIRVLTVWWQWRPPAPGPSSHPSLYLSQWASSRTSSTTYPFGFRKPNIFWRYFFFFCNINIQVYTGIKFYTVWYLHSATRLL